MVRVFLSVLLGALVLAVISPLGRLLGRLVTGRAFYEGGGADVSDSFVLVVALPMDFLGAVLGGFAAALTARQDKTRAVRLLLGCVAGVGLALAAALAVSAVAPQARPYPLWFHFARPVVHVAGILFGAGRVRFFPPSVGR